MSASKELILLLLSLLIICNKCQVVYVSTAASWSAAEQDCNNRGSNLLTAQGNQDEIDECVNAEASDDVWIGLNEDNNGWNWIAGDVQYNVNSVDWAPNNPRNGPSAGDCGALVTSGNREGRIINAQLSCSDLKRYCCNPANNNPSPTGSPTTDAPTNNPTAAPTDIPTTPTTDAPTNSPTSSPTDVPTAPTTNNNCGRIRKEWNTMEQSERDLYINAMLQLSSEGKLQKFVEQHGDIPAEAQAHTTSSFLTWHRLFLFELETQIRNLGGQYACFSLPYWNWGAEVDQYGNNYRSWSILNSGLGGAGEQNDNYCVTDGSFTANVYTPYFCGDNDDWTLPNTNNCCLRRVTYPDGTDTGMYSSQDNDDAVMASTRYGNDASGNGGARREIEYGPHGLAHCTMCACGWGHLGDGFYSPDDPIFFLLHGMVDFLYALWQDVNDYEGIDKNSITGRHYRGSSNLNSEIDDLLEFDILVAEAWSTLDGTARNRDMHSIQDTTYLGYTYEYGSFFDEQNNFPTNLLDPDWFYEDPNLRRRRRRLKEEQYTATKQFTDLAYNQLSAQYGDDYSSDNLDERRELIKTLTKMSCEFRRTNGEECERPAYFDDCSDMELGPNIYNNKQDLNLTLEELIEKVEDYPCMVEQRKLMYPWVAKVGGIWRLCRGDYDRFCDKEFIRKRPQNGDQCEVRGYEKKSKQYSQQGVVFDNNNFKGDNVNNHDILNYDDWNFKQIIMNRNWDIITFIFIIVTIALLMICIFYKKIWKKKGYDKVKYIEEDNNDDI